MQARHMKNETHPHAGWSKKRKAVAGILGFTLFLVGGFALAALLVRGPFQGGGTVSQQPTVSFDNVTSVAQDELISTCTATPAGGTFPSAAVNVTIDGIGGGTCTLKFAFHRTGGGALVTRLQNVEFADGIVNATFPVSACGLNVPQTSIQLVDVTFTIPAAAATGAYSAQADAGLHVVNNGSFNAANCPAAA